VVIDEAIARGHEALKQGRWDDARAEFEAVLATEERPEAAQGLGDALWWLGDASGCLRMTERAYTIYRESGADEEAATMCLWISALQLKSLGNKAACSGWIATGARIVERAGLDMLQGWILWARSSESVDPVQAENLAVKAIARAREYGDRDLELCAMSELGKALVTLGREAEGMALIDEAMAAAMGGESQSLDTVVATCCSMMGACDQAADLERVAQWCRAADRFMETYGSPFLFADCRLRYGSVLLATGHWGDAERELRAAARVTSPETDYYTQAISRLARLRLRQGRLEEAEALLEEIGERPAALLATASLRHERGMHEAAGRILERYIAGPEPEPSERAEALDLLVSCRLAAGMPDAARSALHQLSELAASGMERVSAHHSFAAARAAMSLPDRPAESEPLLEQAMQLFSNCKLPYETARVRLALAQSLAGQPEVAVAEAQGAFATFERLGAVADADEAAQLIRTLGGAARTGPKDVGVLSKREQEVLRLLGAGLSNPEIAERLFLSRKTVSHHVSNILSKLGLRNRSEAAIQAGRLLPTAEAAP
jgi:DNA-binding CsgD family transcriptional regulator